MTAETIAAGTDVHRQLALELSSSLGDDAVTQRSIDRLKYAHDASHYLLVPQTVVIPRQRRAGGRGAAGLRPGRRLDDVPLGRHQPLRPGPHRQRAGRHPQALPGRGGARRRATGAGPARCDRPAGERPARAVPPQAGPGPGQRERLHDRRRGRQQLLGDALRDPVQHLQHPRVDGARAALRDGHRLGRPAGRAGGWPRWSRTCTRGCSGCAGGCWTRRTRWPPSSGSSR